MFFIISAVAVVIIVVAAVIATTPLPRPSPASLTPPLLLLLLLLLLLCSSPSYTSASTPALPAQPALGCKVVAKVSGDHGIGSVHAVPRKQPMNDSESAGDYFPPLAAQAIVSPERRRADRRLPSAVASLSARRENAREDEGQVRRGPGHSIAIA